MNLPILDTGSALKRLEGDRDLYASLAEIFLEDTSPLLQQAGAADAQTLTVSVHRLHGLAAGIGALRAAAAASAIVELARAGQESAARKLLPALVEELSRVEEALSGAAELLAAKTPA